MISTAFVEALQFLLLYTSSVGKISSVHCILVRCMPTVPLLPYFLDWNLKKFDGVHMPWVSTESRAYR